MQKTPLTLSGANLRPGLYVEGCGDEAETEESDELHDQRGENFPLTSVLSAEGAEVIWSNLTEQGPL